MRHEHDGPAAFGHSFAHLTLTVLEPRFTIGTQYGALGLAMG
jgi:hypothetical protein